MTVITILGTIGKKDNLSDRAEYTFDEKLHFKLKKKHYTNMLPLIIDNFTPEYKIVPIYTKDAKKIQQEVLKSEFDNQDYEVIFQEAYFIDNEENFAKVFKLINDAISKDDANIIDLSHGFRHLPILATIALIVNNIENTHRIKHIFFAKEKEKYAKYEIIDLKNYLELANISYLLSTFNQNYTVSGNITFDNPLYQKLANNLQTFSEHFLSNSLKALMDGDIIDDILETLTKLSGEEEILNLNNFIKNITDHLNKIKGLKSIEKEYLKFYEIARMMDKRGYQLNAITLLFEAIGYYCLDAIYQNTDKTKKHIDAFQTYIYEKKQPKHIYSDYALTNQSRNIIKLQKGFKGDYLFNPETITWSKEKLKNTKYYNIPRKESEIIKKEIYKYISMLPKAKLKKFQFYIREMEDFRNNLAHGNSSEEVKKIEKLFERYVKSFETFVIDEDVLNSY